MEKYYKFRLVHDRAVGFEDGEVEIELEQTATYTGMIGAIHKELFRRLDAGEEPLVGFDDDQYWFVEEVDFEEFLPPIAKSMMTAFRDLIVSHEKAAKRAAALASLKSLEGAREYLDREIERLRVELGEGGGVNRD